MLLSRFKSFLTRFRDNNEGTLVVEMVITLPLLFWMIAATYEYFEIHRYKSTREKATYTVADMMSRHDGDFITAGYLDNALALFNDMSNDNGANQIRFTIISYDGVSDEYAVSWSRTRGSGSMADLTTPEVANAHSRLPILQNGEEIILVESESEYSPVFNVGLNNDVPIETRVFTGIRFAPQICYGGPCPEL